VIDDASVVFFMGKFLVGLVIFVRITGIFLTAPFLKSNGIPPQVKIMSAVILAIIVNTSLWNQQPTLEFHLWYLVLLVLKEFLVGMMIGWASNAIFFAARTAGGIVDQDMGFQTATMFDRDAGAPTLLGEFKELIALMVFLFIDGHHYLIEGLFISVKAVPLTTMEITNSSITLFTNMAISVLVLAIKMASPVLIALFLTNLSLALLARIAPQTNIFILSFQLKVSVGLIVLLISIPLFVYVSKIAMEGMQQELYRFILTLYPDRV
jgi:flagellar biosynthetic protein FliR